MSRERAAAAQLKTSGALDPNDDVYIVRQADTDLVELMLRHEYCNILTSRQVGKSSLIYRAAHALKHRGHRVAVVDIAGTLGSPADADQWYLGFLQELVRQLRVTVDVADWWARNAEPTANQRLLRFFRELASLIAAPVSLFVDEIDHTLKFSYTDDFFTAIRSMYNSRAVEPLYQRVTFCLVGVATPNELIKNSRTTAYNVGPTIEVTDFDPARDDLTQLYQAVSDDPESGEKLVSAVLAWTGGHPHLTAWLCKSIAMAVNDPAQVGALVEQRYESLDALRTDPHFVHFEQINRFLEERVQDGAAVLALYERIRRGVPTPAQATAAHGILKLSGLVKRDRTGRLVVRNKLYAKIFSLSWVRASRPLQARRRLRRLTTTASTLAAVLAAALVYNGAVIEPARAAFVTLGSTANEAQAAEAFRTLSGGGRAAAVRWLPTGYGWRATGAYREFWERRAAVFDQRAKQRLDAGALDEACILAAAAAVTRNGAVNPDVLAAYDARELRHLRTTLHPVGSSDKPLASNFNRFESRYSFTPDGRSLLLNWGGSFGPNLLVAADAASGHRFWSYESTAGAFFLGGGDFFAEEGNDEVIVRERETMRPVLGPKRGGSETSNIDDTLGYFATFSTNRVRVWDLELRDALLDVSRPFTVTGIHVAHSKEYIAIEGPGRLEIWGVRGRQPMTVIPTRDVGVSSSLVTFSSDGAYVARLGTTQSTEATRLDVWTRDGQHVLDGAALPGVLETAFFAPRSALLVAQWIERGAAGRRGGAAFDPRVPPGRMAFEGRVQGVADDGRAVATSQSDRLHIWTSDGTGFRRAATIPIEGASSPTEVTFAPADRVVLFKDNGGRVRVWDWEAGVTTGAPPPLDLWRQWQSKFGLTLNDADDVVPLTFRRGPPDYRLLHGLTADGRPIA